MHPIFSKLIILIALTSVGVAALYKARFTDSFFDVIRGEVDSNDCAVTPKRCTKLYAAINTLLATHQPTNNRTARMEFIRKKVMTVECKRLSKEHLLRLSALNLILSLEQTEGPGRCTDRSTSNILESNGQALNNLRKSMLECGPAGTCEPLPAIVWYYLSGYLKSCSYESRLELMDKSQLEKIKSYIGELIGVQALRELFNMFIQTNIEDPKTYVQDHPRAASKTALNMRPKGDYTDGMVTLTHLNKMTEAEKDERKSQLVRFENPDGKSFVNETVIEELVIEHILNPCKIYVDLMDGFFSNRWVTSMLLKLQRGKDEKSGPLMWLAYYRGCGSFKLYLRRMIHSVEIYLLSNQNW